jgi:hypothetical protein
MCCWWLEGAEGERRSMGCDIVREMYDKIYRTAKSNHKNQLSHGAQI